MESTHSWVSFPGVLDVPRQVTVVCMPVFLLLLPGLISRFVFCLQILPPVVEVALPLRRLLPPLQDRQ
jgi:hypothetical protein